MFLLEEVGCKEKLIIHHGMGGLDCSVLILSFRLSHLPYSHLEALGLGLGFSLAAGPCGGGFSRSKRDGEMGAYCSGNCQRATVAAVAAATVAAQLGRGAMETQMGEEFQAQGEG